jgi:phosphoribosylformylglycinamidine synthase
MDPGAVLQALLGSPNLASRRAVFEQYDSTVQAATAAGPDERRRGRDPRDRHTKALVAATDGNAGVSAADPWLGAAMSVAEATRNVAITGARPLGVTNCLNYGDPTKPDAFWQLSEGVRGLRDACLALGLPVTGGNVSLYNESARGRIAPTPRSASLGCWMTLRCALQPAFTTEGDASSSSARRHRVSRAASTRGSQACARGRPARAGPPGRAAAAGVRARGGGRGLLSSAQDVSSGGFATALSECAMWGGVGAHVRLHTPARRRRPVRREPEPADPVSATAHVPAIELLARQHGLPVERIGSVKAIGSSSSSRVPAPLPPRRSAARASPTRSTSRLDDLERAWRTLAAALGWTDLEQEGAR